VASAAAPTAVHAQGGKVTSGRTEANGVSYYYEIHGKGEPLLLLHGGLGSIDMFAPVHYEMFLSPALAPTVLPFLDGKSGAPSWTARP
jgi:pimeloyl-ACP methyl ester carboxylesterase